MNLGPGRVKLAAIDPPTAAATGNATKPVACKAGVTIHPSVEQVAEEPAPTRSTTVLTMSGSVPAIAVLAGGPRAGQRPARGPPVEAFRVQELGFSVDELFELASIEKDAAAAAALLDRDPIALERHHWARALGADHLKSRHHNPRSLHTPIPSCDQLYI